MKKGWAVLLLVLIGLTPVTARGARDASAGASPDVYPAGSLIYWSTGQPNAEPRYWDSFWERNKDLAPNVKFETEALQTMAAGQQKISMYALSGDRASMPDVLVLDTVGVIQMISTGLLMDNNDFFAPIAGEFIDGVLADYTINGKIYSLPEQVRPQMLFYNDEIFKKYNIDPAMMSTFEGYLEAGRLLKQRSNGEVFLSYVDPGSFTWRYYGRRGLMPQAGARIWDDQGNVVIGSDPGTKLALGFFDKLYSEGLLYKTTMLQPPIFEATDEGKIATFYIGAFWDEWLR
ncbi:MAG: extracellular solute-binding protein, partial [Treponema sp.]|nr:extracellular solute-binding protein [Treponema sp.]